jgi:Fe-S cluster assembly ATP-binding protein
MYQGRIVKEGGPELVGVLEEKGYGWIKEEVEAGPNGEALTKGAAA